MARLGIIQEDKRIRNKLHRRIDYLRRYDSELARCEQIIREEQEAWWIENADAVSRLGDPVSITCTEAAPGDIVWEEPQPTWWQRQWNKLQAWRKA